MMQIKSGSNIKSKNDFYEEKINEIVYQLYELTPDQTKIVEENKCLKI